MSPSSTWTRRALALLVLGVAVNVVASSTTPASMASPASPTMRSKVSVQVMYESLCPDSIRFITEQLKPTYDALGAQRMVVELVPYGKASTLSTGNGYSFRCQHGASECRGNMLQACALARLLADNAKQVEFVTCVMSSDNPSRPNEKCITEAGLSAGEIKTCTSGREGQVLLAGMGEKTMDNIKFVPTIVINGEFKQEETDQALSDLLHTVCDKLPAGSKAPACEQERSVTTPTTSS